MNSASSFSGSGLGVAAGAWRWAALVFALVAVAAAGLVLGAPALAGWTGSALLAGIGAVVYQFAPAVVNAYFVLNYVGAKHGKVVVGAITVRRKCIGYIYIAYALFQRYINRIGKCIALAGYSGIVKPRCININIRAYIAGAPLCTGNTGCKFVAEYLAENRIGA